MEHIVIIGNGISGITAARHIRKLSDKKITIVSAETDYFFSRTALMYVYMGHMKFEHIEPYETWFWKKNRIDLVRGYVTQVNPDEKKLTLDESRSLTYDKLVIATGSKSNKFGWPGQDLLGVQGLYSKQDLDQLDADAPNDKICKRAVIVGGGLIGIELAEMLRSRNIPVTFLVRESSFWNGVLPDGESQMINEHILEHHIDLTTGHQFGRNPIRMIHGRVKAVVTDKGKPLPVIWSGSRLGLVRILISSRDSGIVLGKGVKVNRYLETNIDDVYAIGDCAEQHEAIGLIADPLKPFGIPDE